MHDRGRYLADPGVLTARARVSRLPVAVHDGLQDGGERCHAYPGGYEDRVLRSEDMAGRSSVRSIQVNLLSRLFRSYVEYDGNYWCNKVAKCYVVVR